MKNDKFIRIPYFNYSMVMVIVFWLTVWVCSRSKERSTVTRPKDKPRTSIDYFGPNPFMSVKIPDMEYTLIDDYVKCVHVLYQGKDLDAIEKHTSGLLKSDDEAKSYQLHILYHALVRITNDKHIKFM